MTSLEPLDLCAMMLEEMRKLEFSEKTMQYIENSPRFISALGKPETVQRAHLTILINHIFVMGPYIVPQKVRLGLSISTDCRSWLDDLKLVLLPFMKANEDKFFD